MHLAMGSSLDVQRLYPTILRFPFVMGHVTHFMLATDGTHITVKYESFLSCRIRLCGLIDFKNNTRIPSVPNIARAKLHSFTSPLQDVK